MLDRRLKRRHEPNQADFIPGGLSGLYAGVHMAVAIKIKAKSKGPATVLKSGSLRIGVDISWLPHLIALNHCIQDQQKFVHASYERNLLRFAVVE